VNPTSTSTSPNKTVCVSTLRRNINESLRASHVSRRISFSLQETLNTWHHQVFAYLYLSAAERVELRYQLLFCVWYELGTHLTTYQITLSGSRNTGLSDTQLLYDGRQW